MTDLQPTDTVAPVINLRRRATKRSRPKAPEFRCSGYALAQAVKIAKRAVLVRSGALPVLYHFRVAADENGVRVRGTDLDLDLTVPVKGAEVDTPGVCLIPLEVMAKALVGVTARKDRAVTVTRGGTWFEVEMTVGPTTIRPHVGVIEDYPRLAPLNEGRAAILDTALFADIAEALSTDDSRPILGGVHLTPTALAATDSYRLHVVRDLPSIDELPANGIIVPRRAVNELIAMGGQVIAEWDEKTIQFTGDDRTIRARLVEGTFPNWRGLIPVSSVTDFTFDPETLGAAVAEIGRWAGAKTPTRFAIDQTGVTLSVSEHDRHQVEQRVEGTATGPDLTIGFNHEYFGDLLEHIDGPATLGLQDANKPAVVRQPGPGGQGERIRLIMPVRT